jgi:hypothetical protein
VSPLRPSIGARSIDANESSESRLGRFYSERESNKVIRGSKNVCTILAMLCYLKGTVVTGRRYVIYSPAKFTGPGSTTPGIS